MKMRLILLIISILTLVACSGNSNEQAPTTTKAHEPGWLIKHDQKALQDLTGCQVCHEVDFAGNPPVPACMECHSFGIGPFVIHPPNRESGLGWAHPSNHGFYAKENISECQGCHAGLEAKPGSNPRFDTPLGNLEAGCESAPGCHNNNDPVNNFTNGHNPRAAHPSYDPAAPSKQDLKHWYGENIVFRSTPDGVLKNNPLNHSTAGNLTVACALCHGALLKGGAGPACMECHVLDPVANPSRCVSCHGPLPGQQQSAPLKPSQLAQLAGRNDLLSRRTFKNFTSQLTARMRRDPSREKINPLAPLSEFYFAPSAFVSYTSVSTLSRRSSHLHHDTLACEERQDNTTCSACHTLNSSSASNITRHHNLMLSPPRGRSLGCTNCHQDLYGSDRSNLRNCRDCHKEHFCN